MRCCVLLTFSSCIAGGAAALAGELPKGSADRIPDGRPVTRYTKEWTSDYHIREKVVYHAYSKTLKDETGTEVIVEMWHGRATGYHDNGKKAWEVLYRHGKREGEFTSWSKEGARTGHSIFERGQLHGKYTQWADDGRKMREETYRQGKLDGETRWWAPDGKLATVGTYRDGKPWQGKFFELDPSLPRPHQVIRGYEDGKKVSEETAQGGWW
jgi:hypothetical protein